MIDRRVRVISAPRGDNPDDAATRRFSEFANTSNIVVLGNPGSGKTVLFEEAARMAQTDCLKARSFCNRPTSEVADTVFIDALDEQRAGSRDKRSPIDEIVRKLFECRPTRVRISCREQDWLGDTDLAAFNDFFDRSGGATVLCLEPINRDEQIAILIANGATASAAEAFLAEAQQRGIEDFLKNPRKMLMLWHVVAAGTWPKTTFLLFHKATELELSEDNSDHAHTEVGRYTAEELRLPAGGVCAARLISDVQGICLGPNGDTTLYPGYRTLTFLDSRLVRAALHRPLFVAVGSGECVDYDHRTSAEFLAAEWIADRVRHNALPMVRLRSLLGMDGHPTAELRGLNAWLSLTLPEYAELFISADPLGVLEYGDAASLTPSMREALLKALAAAAEENPWFLGPNRTPVGIKQLVQPDSVNALCAILDAPGSPRDLQTLVLEALEAAGPQQGAFETLLRILRNAEVHWGDRQRALTCLHAFGPMGREAILAAYADLAGNAEDILRLRGSILELYYGTGLDTSDITGLFRDLLAARPIHSIGLLWCLADALPLRETPDIIDDIAKNAPARNGIGTHRAAWNAGSFLDRMMTRVLTQSPEALTGPRVLDWTTLRRRLNDLGANSRDNGFLSMIRAHTTLPRAAFEAYIDRYALDQEDSLRAYLNFYKTLDPIASWEDIGQWSLERAQRESDRDRRVFAFGLSAQNCWTGTARSNALFERVFAIGESDGTLAAILAPHLACSLDDWHVEHAQHLAERRRQREEEWGNVRADFTAQRERVRTGRSDLIHAAAEMYFNLSYELDHNVSPRARLVAVIGEENAEAALDGLRSFVGSDRPPPTHEEILQLVVDGRYVVWWRTLAAGVDALIRSGDSSTVPEDTASAILFLDLFHHLSTRLEQIDDDASLMHEELKRLYPAAANAAYLRAITFSLARDEEYVDGLDAYLREDFFRTSRRNNLIDLLEAFPNAKPRLLQSLLIFTLAEPDLHGELGSLTAKHFTNLAIGDGQRRLWLVTGYLLQPAEFEPDVRSHLRDDPDLIWPLRDLLGFESRTAANVWPLAPKDLGFLVAELGAKWPTTERPSGWTGSHNPWDAVDFVRKLIDKLSSTATSNATLALGALIEDPRLEQYRDHLKSARAQHLILRRESEYDRPDWTRTVHALSNHAPAGAADLHALVLDHLRSLSIIIDGSNDNQFTQFWNVTSQGATSKPKPEESCRDILVNMLRLRLGPLGLSVEPEGRMSANKRVDIVVFGNRLKCVIEVKLAHSPDLWAAIDSQLDHLYTRDPDTQGYGILLTLWFGARSHKAVTKRHSDGWRAPTPAELDAALRPGTAAQSNRIASIVVDVSGER